MKTVCFIPIKLNSERIPGKNIKRFCDDTPLMSLIRQACLKTENIDTDIYVNAHAISLFAKPETVNELVDKVQSGEHESARLMMRNYRLLAEKTEFQSILILSTPGTHD